MSGNAYAVVDNWGDKITVTPLTEGEIEVAFRANHRNDTSGFALMIFDRDRLDEFITAMEDALAEADPPPCRNCGD